MTTPTHNNQSDNLKDLFTKTPQDRITALSVSLAIVLAAGLLVITPTMGVGLVAAALIAMRKIAREHSVPMLF